MSDSKKPTSENSRPDEISDRLKSALRLDVNKPDKKEQLTLGSPVSPLRTGGTGGVASTSTTATSSSSSSSGSVSGRPGSSSHATAKDGSHSGEHSSPSTDTTASNQPPRAVRFSSRSTDTSPTARRGRAGQTDARSTDTSTSPGTAKAGHTRPPRVFDSRSPARGGHTRSSSSGSIGTHNATSSRSGGGSVTSPPINVLPAGNIVPSGRINKTGLAKPLSPRPEVLGSGTCNYGHGSIVRGVGAIGGSGSSKSCGSLGGSSGSSAKSVGGSLGGSSGSSAKSPGGSLGGSSGSSAKSVSGGTSSSVSGTPVERAMASSDPEVAKMAGNEQYKKGNFAEALKLYDRAISLSPTNPSYHSNRAAALTAIGESILEAVKECEDAVRLDPNYFRAHQRLGSLLVRIGQVDLAKKHLCLPGILPDQRELLKLQDVEKHLFKCAEARRKKDWNSTLNETFAVMDAGADSCPEIYSCQAECLLKLLHLDEANAIFSKMPKTDKSPHCRSQSKFFGIASEAYLLYVRAQIDMSLGRFENAISNAEKARQIDSRNEEVASLLSTVKLVARTRQRGNDLFKSERFTEASAAYSEGLRLDPCNAVLYCNRAACWYKVGSFEKSIEDCNHALKIQPSYTKALLRRATSNFKLERWSEAVSDYEALHKQLPKEQQIEESMFNAQVALMKSQGKDASKMIYGSEVKKVNNVDEFKVAISFPGVSVVLFKNSANVKCRLVADVLDELSEKYPFINFIKVDMVRNKDIAKEENVDLMPTLKIYKSGIMVTEAVSPPWDKVDVWLRQNCW